MIFNILLFELRSVLKTKIIYIYFFILFLIPFMLIHVAGGAFESISIGIIGGEEASKLNSEYNISKVLSIITLIGVFMIAGVTNNIAFKDFQYNSTALIYTTPITKFQYLTARWLSVFVVSTLMFLGPSLGLILGAEMPYLDRSIFYDFTLLPYLRSFLIQVLPNVFFVVSIFFMLTILLRNIVVNWLSIIVLYVLYFLAGQMGQDLDDLLKASLLDPFGLLSLSVAVADFSPEEINTSSVSLVGQVFYNRLVWSLFGISLLIITYWRFNFFSFSSKKVKKSKQLDPLPSKAMGSVSRAYKNIDKVKLTFNPIQKVKSLLYLSWLELKSIVTNIYFILIMLVGIAVLLITSKAIGQVYETVTYPVTYQVITLFKGSFSLFISIIVIFFTGEQIWKSRDLKVHEIESSLPVQNWQFLVSKIIGIVGVIFLSLNVLICVGVGVQFYQGYENYELGVYFSKLMGISFPYYVLLALLSYFVHIIFNHKYIAYVLMIIFMMWDSFLAQVVLQSNALIYAGTPPSMYSDMNGHSQSFSTIWTYFSYWFSFAAVLMIISNSILVRKTEDNSSIRWREFKAKWKNIRVSVIATATVFIIIGCYIYYNTHVLNEFQESYDLEKKAAEYERQYKPYEDTRLPSITKVNAEYDLYPTSGDFSLSARYTLVNKSTTAIDTLILNNIKEMENVSLNVGYEQVINDEKHEFYVLKLNQPLLPKDSILLQYNFDYKVRGFTNYGVRRITEKNGTFILNTEVLPSLGYLSEKELRVKRIREKHELPERRLEKSRDDLLAIQKNFTSAADFIDLTIQVSTSKDQIAVAPGYCKKQWKEDGRNFFLYKSDVPVINYFAVLSAKYEVYRDKWVPSDTTMEEVEILIYYNKGHEYNLETMMQSSKASLAYYTQQYGAYSHPDLKIVEFPRFASFAQSFPAMIPFSESIGFIADLRKEEAADFANMKIDYPYWVTAHEIAHQWIAHHLHPANVEGSSMILESLTQLSTIKVIENHFSKKEMRKFFRQNISNYLLARQNESFTENPLSTVASHQQYIFYNKGIIVLNALNDYIGSDKLIEVTGQLIKENKFQGPPYITTKVFVERVREVTPDSLQYLVTDGLEKITLYEFEILDAQYERNKSLEYFLDLTFNATKFYANLKGESEVAPIKDEYLEIGVYGKKEKEIFLEKRKIHSGENKIRIKLGRRPNKVIVDPYYKLINKKFLENNKKVKKI